MQLMIEGWVRDLRMASRALWRAPGFTVVTVLTLALAMGANTAIFSVVDAVLLSPIDLPDVDRLVDINAMAPGTDLPEEFGPAPEFYVQYRDNANLLEDIGLYRTVQATVRSEDQSDRLFIANATPDVFTTLGASPQLGRLPSMDDGVGRVVVISDALWREWFGSDPDVIGRSYEVAGAMREVVGVMPPSFRFPTAQTAVWMNLVVPELDRLRPGNFSFNLVARVRPDTDLENLASQLNTLAARLPELRGGSPRYAEIMSRHRAVVRPLEQAMVGDVARPIWILMGTVAVVLLIACANVANLFSVRGEGRRRDLDVRQALGAGRGGLVRGQMAEAIVLAALGAVAGVFLAWVGLPVLVGLAPENVPNLDLMRLDGLVLAFTASVAAVVAIAFGLIPAIRLSRPRMIGGLREAGRAGGRRGLGRHALVLFQTSAALVLLVGAGLLLRSFWTLRNVDPGFDTEDIFTFQVAPQREELRDGPSYARFHQDFMELLRGIPSVETVGLAGTIPLDEGADQIPLHTEATLLSGEEAVPSNYAFIGGDYFDVMGIPVTRGRGLGRADQEGGQINAVVSVAAADQLWPGQDPLGQRLFPPRADSTQAITVVGVVGDVYLNDLRQPAPDPMIYLPMVGPTPRTWAVESPAYVVKSTRAGELEPEIRSLIWDFMPESPMYRVSTMGQLADRSMSQLSFTMMMLLFSSVLALVLGAVGLFGVLSYVVSQRAPEIAVRMALGAEASGIQRMVVAEGARVTLLGVSIGLVAALVLTRLLESLLFGVGSFDVITFLATSGVMMGVAALATYLPARRASSMDPIRSLRTE